VLRPLPFVAVGKQQHDPGVLAPLRAIGRDELIDDRLRDVHEITVLSFPQYQSVLGRRTVPVLETEHGHLRERTVVDLDPAVGLRTSDVLERNVDLSRLRVVKHRLPV